MNKKGDIASIIFAVVIIFAIGITLFLINHINQEIYGHLQQDLNSSYNDTEAYSALTNVKEFDESVWDYAFLAIFMGIIIALGLMAYAIRISPVFYWIYGFMSLIVLAVGVIASNIWQSMSTDPEFTATLARFPMTDAILGSYYPLIVVAIIIIGMVVLFGKPFGREEGYI